MKSEATPRLESAETGLESSRVRALWEALNRVQAVIEFDLQGCVLEANANFLELMGYTLEDIRGRHHRLFCEAAYVETPEYAEFWRRLAAGQFHSGVFKRKAKDGREVWIQASYNPVLGADGKPQRVIKFATDVTQAKLQHADFAGKLAAIDASQAVIEFDLEGCVLTANQNFLDLLGYTLREVKGKHHRLFCDESYVKTRDYTAFWAKLGKGEFHSGRFMRMGKHGQRIWIQATYNPIRDVDGRVSKVVKFATDITEQIEREEEIASNTKGMQSAVDQLVSEIIAVSGSAKVTTEQAEQSSKLAERGEQSVEAVMKAMQEIQRSSTDIREIVSLIQDIAGQTNLLAFNAAIEAARAGTHGLGFSVVAEEVRRLAEKSAEATRKIESLMDTSVQRIEHGTTIAREADEAFHSIHESVERTHASINQIDKSSREQSELAAKVHGLIETLSKT